MVQRACSVFRKTGFWSREKVDEMVAAAGGVWQDEDNRRATARLKAIKTGDYKKWVI